MSFKSKYPRSKLKIYAELVKNARNIEKRIEKQCGHRDTYVRAKSLRRKIFITKNDLFWTHLYSKNQYDRKRRLRYYQNALDLIRNTTDKPALKKNPNGKRELVYEYHGITSDGFEFVVHIKEEAKRLYFMSVFPS
ncbi:MAG: hypothetical protein LBL84_01115 [Candidatus Nomurabacteria bacterium]|nr:hypothetical protein [Candidatus Nomurabacteria bacterium]